MAIAEVLARLSAAEARFSRPRAQAKLSKAQAKCAQELQELSRTHTNSPAWATGGIAAVVRFCHEPASATDSVCALFNLSAAEANWTAIIEAGAIPPLVALLSGGPESDAVAKAAGALSNLADHAAGIAHVISAGAIPPLVALLGGGAESKAATSAAGALDHLASDTHTTAAVLEEVARTTADCSSRNSLHAKLRKSASEQLQKVVNEGTNAAALEHAIILARAATLEKSIINRAVEQLGEIHADTERQKRREALGLGSLELPNELKCPITFKKMRGMPLPPHSPLASHAALPPRLHLLRHRTSGGVRRLLVRAVRYRTEDRRRQSREPAHPRAAPAGRAHTEPQPEEAHFGVQGLLTGYGGRGVQAARRDRGEPSSAAGCGQRAG